MEILPESTSNSSAVGSDNGVITSFQQSQVKEYSRKGQNRIKIGQKREAYYSLRVTVHHKKIELLFMASDDSDPDAEYTLSRLLQRRESFSLACIAEARFEDERSITDIAKTNNLNAGVQVQDLKETIRLKPNKVEAFQTSMVATFEEHEQQENQDNLNEFSEEKDDAKPPIFIDIVGNNELMPSFNSIVRAFASLGHDLGRQFWGLYFVCLYTWQMYGSKTLFIKWKIRMQRRIMICSIIDFYMSKDQSISKRNKMFWHTTRDDPMFNTIRVILRYQDTQIYEDIRLDVLTSQDMLEFKAYKEYYAFPTRAVLPKAKTTYKKKAKEPVTSKTASESVSKGPRLKTQAKTKQTRKKTNAKGLTMLTKAALSEADQLKLVTKRSKKDFHISHASGSGDGVGRLSKVPDEQEQEDSSTTEGTDTLSRVPDVPKYKSKSDMKSWGDSEEEGDDDDDGNNDDEGGNDDKGNDDAESDDEQTEFKNNDDESMDNEDDEEVKVLYDDTDEPLQSSSVSSNFISKFLNLENPALTNTEIALLMKTLASQDTIPLTTPTLFTHVTQQQQTPTLPTTTSITIPELLDFASLFKFDQRVLALEIKLSELKQTNQFTKAISSIPGIVDKYLAFKLKEAVNVDTTMKSIIKDQVKAQVSKIMPKVEKYVTESLGAEVLVRSTNQSQTVYAVAASLPELELKKILMDKMKANKSIKRADTQRTLYNALVAQRSRPSAGSDRGMKRRRTSKDAYSSKDPRSKEKRSTNSSKEAFKSRHTSSSESVHLEEPSYNVEDTSKHQDQEYVMGKQMNNPMTRRLLNPTDSKSYSRASGWTGFNLLKGTCKSLTELEYHPEECFKATTKKLYWNNPENKPYPFNLRKPLPLTQDRRGRQIIRKDYFINDDLEYLEGGDSSRSYSTSVTKTKAASYDFKWIEDMGPKRQSFYCYASNLTSSKDVYSRRRIITVTRLKIKRKYDCGYLEEIEVRRDDQQIYTFKEGDFSRIRLQDFKDMLLLLT
nr:hypothetical protein [Tanacetum cinerariifolium]